MTDHAKATITDERIAELKHYAVDLPGTFYRTINSEDVLGLIGRVETAEARCQVIAEAHIARGNAGKPDLSKRTCTAECQAAGPCDYCLAVKKCPAAHIYIQGVMQPCGHCGLPAPAVPHPETHVVRFRGQHLRHCYQDDNPRCKYGEEDCPARSASPQHDAADVTKLRRANSELSHALVNKDKTRLFRSIPSREKMIGGSDVCATCEAHCVVMIEDEEAARSLGGKERELVEKWRTTVAYDMLHGESEYQRGCHDARKFDAAELAALLDPRGAK